MIELAVYRQKLIKLYKHSQYRLNIILKFLGGLAFFFMLSSACAGALPASKKLVLVALCALITSVASPMVFLVLSMAAAAVFIAAVSVETAIVVFILLFLLFLFYGRIFPKESLIFIIMLVGYKLKIPYAAVIFAAIYVGARAIVPVGAAVIFSQFEYCLAKMVSISPTSGFSESTIADHTVEIFSYLCGEVYGHINSAIFVMAAVVIALVAGWAVSSLHINYEKEAGIIVTAAILIIGIFLAVIIGGAKVSVIGLPVSVVLSAAIVFVMRLFDDLPDYKSTEWVQFQDNNYFYYVKAVPKIHAFENEEQSFANEETQRRHGSEE